MEWVISARKESLCWNNQALPSMPVEWWVLNY